jgi:S1/P1 Nuclease
MKSLVCFVLVSMLIGSSICWGEHGHMLIARIAQYTLVNQSVDPQAYEWANALLFQTKNDSRETNWPFIESAAWADRIRSSGDRSMDSWHFINTPLIADGFTEAKIPAPKPTNITQKLADIFILLSRPEVGSGTVDAAQNNPKGNWIRWAIHLMGDLHQPLHCVSRFSAEHPRGDAGGNAVNVIVNGKTDNLHSIWDSMFDRFSYVNTPLNEYKLRRLSDSANQILSDRETQTSGTLKSQIASEDYSAVTTYMNYADESYRAAFQYAYQGITQGATLSDSYKARSTLVVLERLYLAGLRLAHYISRAYRLSHPDTGASASNWNII